MQADARTQLKQVATRLSQAVQQQMQRIVAEQEAQRRDLEERKRAEALQQAAENVRVEAGIAKRLPYARRGLAALIELGRSAEIQEILAAIKRPHIPAYMLFYQAQRVAGWYWDASKEDIRKVEEEGGVLVVEDIEDDCTFSSRRSPYDEEQLSVFFKQDSLTFSSGAAISCSGGICYEVFYEPLEDMRGQKYQVVANGTRLESDEEILLSLSDFLCRIARAGSVNMAAIAHLGQRSHHWEPEEVFFQLIVSCARKGTFNRYLGKCLVAVEREQRDRK